MSRHLPPSPQITREVRGLPGYLSGYDPFKGAVRLSSGLDPFNCRLRWVRLGSRSIVESLESHGCDLRANYPIAAWILASSLLKLGAMYSPERALQPWTLRRPNAEP
jgi:hypothetical protein